MRTPWVDGIKVTETLILLMEELLKDDPEVTGYRLTQLPRDNGKVLGPARVYPSLEQLEAHEWIVGEWEEPNPRPEGTGQRRFYRLTPLGRTRAHLILGHYHTL